MEISTSSATIVSSPSYLPIFFPKSKDPYSISRRILRFSISPKNNGNESELRSDSNDSSLVPILINRTLSKDAAMGLVLSATNVRGWSTSSAMEGPPVPAVSESESSTEKFSTFPWNNSLILDNSLIGLALIDALTGQVVSSGPISAAKAEIVVLEGDFDGNEVNNWTHEEFKSNLVREREGKKTLLTGDAFLNLKEGVGLLGEISFTDNSSWTRSRKFRLGARVMDNWDGIRVREAKTESFIVRDHRGELYKKHYPSSLYDEVWRLEKIVKEGAFHKHLSREKVNKVKDFLTLLFLDPARLRYILGTGMSAKMWEVTVEHARTCVLDKKIYLFCPRSQEKTGVVFNVVGQLMGLLSDCQYVPTDGLSETEKADAYNSVILAFKQWEEVVSFDDESALVDGSSILNNALDLSKSPMVGSSDGIEVLTSDRVGSFDYPQLDASLDIMPSIYSMEFVDSMDDYGIHSIESIDVRFDQTLNFPDQVSNSLSMICDTDSITQALCEDDHLQYFDTDCSLQDPILGSQADLHSVVSGFLYARSAAAVAMVKAHRRWTIIFSVIRWFSIRRIVARKSMLEKHRYIANSPCPNMFQSEMQL